MTPTEQYKELRDLLEQNGCKFYEELNGFRKESKFTIPMFSTDQSKNYDTLSAGNYYELAELITAEKLALLDKLAEQDNVDQDFSSRAIIEGQNYAQFNYRRAIQQEREAITKGVGL